MVPRQIYAARDILEAHDIKAADYVIANATNGSIIIMHVMYESRGTSRQALRSTIDGLKARGFEFVAVSQLLAE